MSKKDDNVCPTKKYSKSVPGTARKQNPNYSRGNWLGEGYSKTKASEDVIFALGGSLKK